MRMSMRTSAKKAVNLSINATLLREAKSQGLNLSKLLERALAEENARLWLTENKAAIDAYNQRIELQGIWSDGWRSW